MMYVQHEMVLPCINCGRGRKKDGKWMCVQDGFRPRPINLINNCLSLKKYLEFKKKEKVIIKEL